MYSYRSFTTTSVIEIQHRLVGLLSFHPVITPLLFIFGEKVMEKELRMTKSGHLLLQCGNGKVISFEVSKDIDDEASDDDPNEESWGYYVPIDERSSSPFPR
jgi:hypothetical protein